MRPPALSVTIAIPTWNRAQILPRTLDALVEISVPAATSVEILVVDNGSTDSTAAVLSRYAEVGIRGAREAKPGRSNALNCSVEIASGDYIIWIDDDIRVERDWLLNYVAAFRADPAAAVFGGSIMPEFKGNPPAWLKAGLEAVAGVYGVCRPPHGEVCVNGAYLPFGGNMAVRRNSLGGRRFDPNLGRRHGAMLGGEEAELTRDILNSGGKGVWVPEARAWHLITEPMQTLSHIRRYYHGLGASLQLVHAHRAGPARLPAWVYRQAVEYEFRYRLGRLVQRHPCTWLADLCQASSAQGMISAHRATSRARPI